MSIFIVPNGGALVEDKLFGLIKKVTPLCTVFVDATPKLKASHATCVSQADYFLSPDHREVHDEVPLDFKTLSSYFFKWESDKVNALVKKLS